MENRETLVQKIATQTEQNKNLRIEIGNFVEYITPLISEKVEEKLIESAKDLFKNSEVKIEPELAKKIKPEIIDEAKKAAASVKKELLSSKDWYFDDLADDLYSIGYYPTSTERTKDRYQFVREVDLSKNKKLWEIVRKSSIGLDKIFKTYNFPCSSSFGGYSSEYYSPYRLTITQSNQLFQQESEINDKMKLYWDNAYKLKQNQHEIEIANKEIERIDKESAWDAA